MAMDWRIQAAATTTSDLPAAHPGGPAHPAGSLLFLVSQAFLEIVKELRTRNTLQVSDGAIRRWCVGELEVALAPRCRSSRLGGDDKSQRRWPRRRACRRRRSAADWAELRPTTRRCPLTACCANTRPREKGRKIES